MSDKVTLNELIKEFSEKTGLSETKSREFVHLFFKQVLDELKEEGKSSITNFGSFEIQKVAEREGVNPQTGEPLVIPEHNRVSFSAFKYLEEKVNAEFSDLEITFLEKKEPEKKTVQVTEIKSSYQPEPIPKAVNEEEVDEPVEKEVVPTPPVQPVFSQRRDTTSSKNTGWLYLVPVLIIAAIAAVYFLWPEGDQKPVASEYAEQPKSEEQPASAIDNETEASDPVATQPSEGNEAAVAEEVVDEATPSGLEDQLSEYSIEKDDWFWDISEKVYGVSWLWPLIFEANRSEADDPDQLFPNRELVIPSIKGTASNLTEEDRSRLKEAYMMVSNAYKSAGKPDKSEGYRRLSERLGNN